MGALGYAVSAIVGAAVDVFYRRRMLAGDIPALGPVLLIANHPNGLLDPVVVQQSARRRVRVLAKAPLFSMPGVSILVKAVDCLPVYRSQDGADTKHNAQTFRDVEAALARGACVLIFPEGISHDEPQVQQLKTGAARMALGAVMAGAHDLVIVPVGLTYADKLRYRSTAAVEVGPPIPVRPFLPAMTDDTDALRNAARSLTAAMEQALRAVTTNVQHWEDLAMLDAVDAIWRQQDADRTRRSKALADGVEHLRATHREALDDVRTRLSAWLDALQALGLTPRDVARDGLAAAVPARRAAFALRHLAAATLGLPLAALGAAAWCVPFQLVHAIWHKMQPDRDVGATVKVLAGLVLFPAWYALAIAALTAWATPAWAAAFACVAPGAGLTTRHYMRRRFAALKALVGALRMRARGQALQDLLDERDAMERCFDALAALTRASPGDDGAPSADPLDALHH